MSSLLVYRQEIQSLMLVFSTPLVNCCSVADPGCLSRIPDPTFIHPGSELSPSPDLRSSTKNLCILTSQKVKKWFLSSKKYDPGCSFRIPDPDADFLPSRIQGSKRHTIPDPDPQHWYDYVTLVLSNTKLIIFNQKLIHFIQENL